MAICSEIIPSEEYGDFIIQFGRSNEEILNEYEAYCVQITDYKFAVSYAALKDIPEISVKNFNYYTIPKLYGLMDTSAVAATGALRLQNEQSLNLTGRSVIIGFVDTGIDYTNRIFQNITGQTRILNIWDQTISDGKAPESFQYGSEYSREDINKALSSPNPYDVVPSRDTNGHGTFMAGVATGRQDMENDFSGAAPESDIVVVKLKPAKQYLRDYFFIDKENGRNRRKPEAFQENDIMLAVAYLRQVALRENKPLVIVLGIGTGSGDHAGGSALSQMLNEIGQIMGNCIVVASGNEGNARLHYRGDLQTRNSAAIAGESIKEATDNYRDVEVKVAEGDNGFVLELWGDTPDLFSVSFISPSGESVSRIPARIRKSDRLDFIIDRTTIDIDYSIVESGGGGELIFMRFITPSAGIWIIRVYGANLLKGRFDIWFNVKQFVDPETYFINPDPDTTLTVPSATENVITLGGYDNRTNAIYINTGRGYTRTDKVKPDLVASAVDVYGPNLNKGYTRQTGTSCAAALVAGNCAQLMQWGIIEGNEIKMRTAYIKNYLIRGAIRDRNITYPNTQWGYGKVNVYEAFTTIIRT